MILMRLGIAAAIIGIGFGAYAAGTRLQAQRVKETGSALLSGLRPGIPAIIYFWSEDCPPCKLVQKPALETLQAELGPAGIQVVAVNAMEDFEIADEWGVLSLPTTFLIDSTGEPRKINHGVVRAEQLRQQIDGLAV